MEKFIIQNWLKIIIGIITIILGFYFTFSLPRIKQTEITNQQNCSKKAEEIFKEYMVKAGDYEREYNSTNYNYENHYSSKLNGCFVLIANNTENYYRATLFNAYENKELGGIYSIMQIAGICGLQIGGSYEVCKNVEKEGKLFEAKEEFDNLAKFYMAS